MIIIGDSLTSDMAGGIKFGTKTCYYNRSRKPIPGDIKVDYVVETLSEIENIL